MVCFLNEMLFTPHAGQHLTPSPPIQKNLQFHWWRGLFGLLTDWDGFFKTLPIRPARHVPGPAVQSLRRRGGAVAPECAEGHTDGRSWGGAVVARTRWMWKTLGRPKRETLGPVFGGLRCATEGREGFDVAGCGHDQRHVTSVTCVIGEQPFFKAQEETQNTHK